MNLVLGPGSDFISGFIDFTKDTPSPEIFRRWGAITTLAGALEQKVWLRVFGVDLYPHMYTALVAPPGVGKTFVTKIVEKFWRSNKEMHLAPANFSFASLGDILKDSIRRVIRPTAVPPYQEFNSLLIIAEELTSLLPEYDATMMGRLTRLYDNSQWDEQLRSGQIKYVVEKPQINLLMGATPAYFNSIIPDPAWEQGFLARIMLVYAGEIVLTNPFLPDTMSQKELDKLIKVYQVKSNLFGKMDLAPEVEQKALDWYMGGAHPIPGHPKLRNYLTRRLSHLMKISMVASVSRNDRLKIEMEDLERAMKWLFDTESRMEDIFKAAATVGDGKVIEDAYYFIYSKYTRTHNKPIRASELTRFVSARVPAHSVQRIITVMIDSGLIAHLLGDDGMYYYKPKPKVD